MISKQTKCTLTNLAIGISIGCRWNKIDMDLAETMELITLKQRKFDNFPNNNAANP